MFICDISILNRIGKLLLDERLKKTGFDWREMVVLMVLNNMPGAPQSLIGRFLQTDKANVSNLITSLEERDFVKRVVNESDRRYKELHLTAKSYELIPTLQNILEDWEGICYSVLSQEEIEIYEKLNDKIIKNLLEQTDY